MLEGGNLPVISKLLEEHDHIRKMLNLLEKLYLDLCRGKTQDYPLMLSSIVYTQEYLEQTHHPLEDEIFSILLERGGEETALVRELIKDHTELELVTQSALESLESVMTGAHTGESGLKQDLATFLVHQREHLYKEENRVFPLINDVLTERDWKNLETAGPDIVDPVFGERTRSEYERLYREITESDETASDPE